MNINNFIDFIKEKVRDLAYSDVLYYLWESGIIGVEVCCDTKNVKYCEAILPKKNIKFDLNIKNEFFNRWYFFEYSYEGSVNDLIKKISNDYVQKNIIIHPIFIKEFVGAISTMWPIGI